MNYLVKFCKNYADEFDVYGFQIYTQAEWNRLEEVVENCKTFSFFEWYFGTNEYICFESPKQLLACLKKERVEIFDEEIETLKKFFPEGYFGSLPDADYLEGMEEDW